MEAEILKKVIKSIYQRFPEFNGSKPKIRTQETSKGTISNSNEIYVLTFLKTVKLDNDLSMPRSLRVTVSEQGKILKVSTSR
jgi:hypothetical protein